MRNLGAIGILAAAVLVAGCADDAGTMSSDLLMEVKLDHIESSEVSRATIASVPKESWAYSDISVDIDGKFFSFGEFMSFDDRRYQVDGKKDDSLHMEAGDVLSIPAAGRVMVKILARGEMIASYEANIPDNRAPAAPHVMEPAAKASGVSKMPTFRWSAVSDPGGITYTLVYSVDPAMSAPILTTKVEKLISNAYTVPAGKELVGGQTYYWKVMAVDGFGNMSPASQTAEFSVSGTAIG